MGKILAFADRAISRTSAPPDEEPVAPEIAQELRAGLGHCAVELSKLLTNFERILAALDSTIDRLPAGKARTDLERRRTGVARDVHFTRRALTGMSSGRDATRPS
jgi:hypothetical protein